MPLPTMTAEVPSLFHTARTAKRRVETVAIERLTQGLRIHDVGVLLGTGLIGPMPRARPSELT
jgi:hypothetical protein